MKFDREVCYFLNSAYFEEACPWNQDCFDGSAQQNPDDDDDDDVFETYPERFAWAISSRKKKIQVH